MAFIFFFFETSPVHFCMSGGSGGSSGGGGGGGGGGHRRLSIATDEREVSKLFLTLAEEILFANIYLIFRGTRARLDWDFFMYSIGDL